MLLLSLFLLLLFRRPRTAVFDAESRRVEIPRVETLEGKPPQPLGIPRFVDRIRPGAEVAKSVDRKRRAAAGGGAEAYVDEGGLLSLLVYIYIYIYMHMMHYI